MEHDADEIWQTVLDAAATAALADAGVRAGELDAIGITNQRETTLVWDRRSGEPIGRAIVWQDRRTAARCAELPVGADPRAHRPHPRSVLLGDEARMAARERRRRGRPRLRHDRRVARCGSSAASTPRTSRTPRARCCSTSRTLEWDDELLDLFSVPRAVLPRLVPSSGVVGEGELLGALVPVGGIAGDQQAALFGQRCFTPGQAKATYGTGAFVLVNAGSTPAAAPDGVLRTVAWQLGDDDPVYALEGAVFVAGAAIQWLRDGLGLIESAAETEALARSLDGNEGVYFVPALAGLGAPHWAPDARGLIAGLTGGTRREHLVRAALEAIAFQTCDVLDAMEIELDVLRADGGASGERLPDAASGRPRARPGRGGRGAGGDRARRRLAGRARGRHVAGARGSRAGRPAATRYEPSLDAGAGGAAARGVACGRPPHASLVPVALGEVILTVEPERPSCPPCGDRKIRRER